MANGYYALAVNATSGLRPGTHYFQHLRRLGHYVHVDRLLRLLLPAVHGAREISLDSCGRQVGKPEIDLGTGDTCTVKLVRVSSPF